MLPVVVAACVLLGLVARAYTWLSWSAYRRWGPRALTPIWLAASLACGAWGGLHAARTAARVKPVHAAEVGREVFGLFLVAGLVAFGLTTLSVRRRLLPDQGNAWGTKRATRAVGAFFANLGLCLLPVLILGLVRHWR